MGDGGPSKVSQNEVADGWFLFFVSCLFGVGGFWLVFGVHPYLEFGSWEDLGTNYFCFSF